MREETLRNTKNPKSTTFLPSSYLLSFFYVKAGILIILSTHLGITTNLISFKMPGNFFSPVLILSCLIFKMIRFLHINISKVKKNLMFRLKKSTSVSLISRLYKRFHHFLDFPLFRILPYSTLKPNLLRKIRKVQLPPSKKTPEIQKALKYPKTLPVAKT